VIKKVRPHVNQNEPLLFERSSPGKRGYQLPPLDVPAVDPATVLGASNTRSEIADFPEVSEVEAIRHFTRLSTQNYAIDLGLYPLGSCTMKYNPRVNEQVARERGLAWAHPYQPESLAQGIMQVMAALEQALAEITGMDAVTLQPAAGAHGEFTGILLVRALLESQGHPRRKLLIPDSAHGTNPATASMAGYAVQNIKSNALGMVDVDELARSVDEDVAALMLTNPNTLGVFEEHIARIAEILHVKGAQLYMDGANMNALVGIARPGDFGADVMHLNLHKTFSTPHGGGGPGSGPVALTASLAPYAPLPWIVHEPHGPELREHKIGPAEHSLGRLKGFHGQMGMFVRALAYMMSHGSDGLRQVAEDAVLNANYVRARLTDELSLSFAGSCMHEVLFDDRFLKDTEVTTLDFAKALIDEGYHPMTMYFPLIVHGAMLIEPTETESKASLDEFITVVKRLAAAARSSGADRFLSAPGLTPRRRLDETTAARKPILRWRPAPERREAAE
jgi:glycine dehydrogenase subunit 2